MQKLSKLKNYNWSLINDSMVALHMICWGIFTIIGFISPYPNEFREFTLMGRILPSIALITILTWVINTFLYFKKHKLDKKRYLVDSVLTFGVFLYEFMGPISYFYFTYLKKF